VELTWLEYYEIQRYSCTFVKKSVFSGGAAAICLAAAWPADLTGCGNSLTADPGSGRGSQAARADPPRAGQQQQSQAASSWHQVRAGGPSSAMRPRLASALALLLSSFAGVAAHGAISVPGPPRNAIDANIHHRGAMEFRSGCRSSTCVPSPLARRPPSRTASVTSARRTVRRAFGFPTDVP
jgi:hypothetical protein